MFAVLVTLKIAVNNKPVEGAVVRKPGGPTSAKCSESTVSVEAQREPAFKTAPMHSRTMLPPASRLPEILKPAGARIVWLVSRVISKPLKASEPMTRTGTVSCEPTGLETVTGGDGQAVAEAGARQTRPIN